jgi:hypothetical protein
MEETTSDDEDRGRDVHFDLEEGYLSFECRPEAFAKIKQIVAGELEDIPDLQLDKIDRFEISNAEQFTRPPEPTRLVDHLTCAVTITLFLFLFAAMVIGLGVIVAWLFSN